MTQPVDVGNRNGVGAQGNRVVLLFPTHSMTTDQALTLAAWLVTVAQTIDPTPGRFEYILEAVRST